MITNRVLGLRKINPFVALLVIVMFILILFWIAKSVLKVLSFIAPVVFVAALVINYRVILGYGKWLLGTIKRNPIFGIIACIFTVIGFPVVSIFLLLRALSTRGISQHIREEAFTPYDEVQDDFLDLSEIKSYEKNVDDNYKDIL